MRDIVTFNRWLRFPDAFDNGKITKENIKWLGIMKDLTEDVKATKHCISILMATASMIGNLEEFAEYKSIILALRNEAFTYYESINSSLNILDLVKSHLKKYSIAQPGIVECLEEFKHTTECRVRGICTKFEEEYFMYTPIGGMVEYLHSINSNIVEYIKSLEIEDEVDYEDVILEYFVNKFYCTTYDFVTLLESRLKCVTLKNECKALQEMLKFTPYTVENNNLYKENFKKQSEFYKAVVMADNADNLISKDTYKFLKQNAGNSYILVVAPTISSKYRGAIRYVCDNKGNWSPFISKAYCIKSEEDLNSTIDAYMKLNKCGIYYVMKF